MRILIFGGTTEGRKLSHALADLGAEVTVSVATDYGREEQGEDPRITVQAGRLDQGEMEALLQTACLCVDATHPYAAQVSANCQAACRATGREYLRLLREESPVPPGTVVVESPQEAARFLEGTTENILLTTGAKELPAFAHLGGLRLYPRVLPSAESLLACEKAGIPRSNILALQGPFSQKFNEAILEQYAIGYLVTKDGGKVGGFTEKAAAAQALGVTLVLIRRPEQRGGSFEDVLRRCKERILCT